MTMHFCFAHVRRRHADAIFLDLYLFGNADAHITILPAAPIRDRA